MHILYEIEIDVGLVYGINSGFGALWISFDLWAVNFIFGKLIHLYMELEIDVGLVYGNDSRFGLLEVGGINSTSNVKKSKL